MPFFRAIMINRKEVEGNMKRKETKTLNSITYSYHVIEISKGDMLKHFYTILKDDDTVEHGLILTESDNKGNWLDNPIELPTLPDEEEFVEYYKGVHIGCMTAIMEYHGMPLLMSYRPFKQSLNIIIPKENSASIDEIEKKVIPDAIDNNPEE